MAAHTERPVILPMSNPTPLAEAKPEDLVRWTGGRALIATGSPFPPVTHEGVTHVIGQANNALVFPGLGLGAIVSRATRITDGMLLAAAERIAETIDTGPPAAAHGGVARTPIADAQLDRTVREAMWSPVYRPIQPV